jgi:hypothetical protein
MVRSLVGRHPGKTALLHVGKAVEFLDTAADAYISSIQEATNT